MTDKQLKTYYQDLLYILSTHKMGAESRFKKYVKEWGCSKTSLFEYIIIYNDSYRNNPISDSYYIRLEAIGVYQEIEAVRKLPLFNTWIQNLKADLIKDTINKQTL